MLVLLHGPLIHLSYHHLSQQTQQTLPVDWRQVFPEARVRFSQFARGGIGRSGMAAAPLTLIVERLALASPSPLNAIARLSPR